MSLLTILAGPRKASPYAGYLVYDTFTDDDAVVIADHGPERGGAYTQGDGNGENITIESNVARFVKNVNTQKFAALDVNVTDITVRIRHDCPAGNFGGGGIIFRFDHLTGHGLLMSVYKGAKASGISANLVIGWGISVSKGAGAMAAPNAGQWYDLRVLCSPTHFSAWFDGNLIIDNAPNTDYASNGGTGIGWRQYANETAIYWDDLVAT